MSAHGAALDGGDARSVARQALREQVEAISRTGRVLAETNPDLAEKFLLPPIRTDQALLTAARLLARDAASCRSAFVTHEMPKTFLSDFDAAIEQFAQGLQHRNAGREEHLAARSNIQTALTSGWAAVKKLNVLVANRLHGDPATLAVWEHDRHVEGLTHSKRGVRTAATYVAAATTTAATVAVNPASPSTPEVSTAAPQASCGADHSDAGRSNGPAPNDQQDQAARAWSWTTGSVGVRDTLVCPAPHHAPGKPVGSSSNPGTT